MMKLDNFIGMMTGCFDNKEQFNMMQATGKIYGELSSQVQHSIIKDLIGRSPT